MSMDMSEVPGVLLNSLQFEDAPKPAPSSRRWAGAIHCACGLGTCQTKIYLDAANSMVRLWVEDRDNVPVRDHIFLDANGAVALIRQLQVGVRQLMEPPTS